MLDLFVSPVLRLVLDRVDVHWLVLDLVGVLKPELDLAVVPRLVLELDAVITLVVISETDFFSGMICECGLWISAEVDVVNLIASVVVSGEDNAADESLLCVGVEVVLAHPVDIMRRVHVLRLLLVVGAPRGIVLARSLGTCRWR